MMSWWMLLLPVGDSSVWVLAPAMDGDLESRNTVLMPVPGTRSALIPSGSRADTAKLVARSRLEKTLNPQPLYLFKLTGYPSPSFHYPWLISTSRCELYIKHKVELKLSCICKKRVDF